MVVSEESAGDRRAQCGEASATADVSFADLVDVANLQSLMDSFNEVTGLANAVIDPQGTVITHSGWQDLCTQFHRANPATRRRCVASDTSLAGSMTRGERFAEYRCLNGLVDSASPIIVGGRHLANIFTGQFFVEPPDMDYFRRQAAEFGFDEAAYLDAVARVPVIAPARVKAVTGVYARLAQTLAANGMDRLRQQAAERSLAEANRGLELRTQQLEAANKELEEFSYSISHDLRTPLRAIDGYAKILLEDHGERLGEDGTRLTGLVRDNARRMGRMIDDILRFMRLSRRKMECGRVDVVRLASEVVAELHAAAPARPLRVEVGALPQAWGDVGMLRLVMQNLLANALKFSPTDAEAVIEVGGAVDDEECSYYVRDRGVGFDMQYAGKLFKVFERVHATGQFEGSGIGLAIVKRIVDRHGGRVWAEGKEGEGATFHFALPQRRK